MMILYVCFFWLLISVIAAYRENGTSIRIYCEAQCSLDKETAYAAYLGIPEFYTSLSKAHKEFFVLDKNWEEGGLIRIKESAGFQDVIHHYVLKELIPGDKIYLVSLKSKVRVLGVIHTTNRTDVTFSFLRGEEKDSKICLEILIIFSNRISQILAYATGTKIIWSHHAIDEMKGLIPELEKRA
jgi:hypothetical protein